MPPRPATAPAPVAAPSGSVRYLVIALTVFALFAMFTEESGDADTWFHLRTGQWMLANHTLPIPDPFAWTTYMGKPVYPNEYFTRDFNLRHEWLGQVVMYLEWAAGGAAGLVLSRAACVTLLCLLVGWIAWRRTGNFYLGAAAAMAASTLARDIAVDRPYVFTYLLLALTMLILERRRHLWVLIPLFVVWANLHGGYFSGWIVAGAYCAEALVERWRGKPPADERTLWGCGVGAVLATGLNPTVFGIIPAMLAYRQSPLQHAVREWHTPALWPPSWFSVLLVCGAAAMLLAWRRVRVADWLIFGVFSTLALMAQRNVIFVGMFAPIMIATYAPKLKWRLPRAAELAAVAVLLAIAGERIASGHAFQLRVASWKYPDGAVTFLKDHHVTGRMYNLYEWGGYLMWALWPQEKTFIDGRALNESVFQDYARIAFNSPDMNLARLNMRSRAAQTLLDQYGVQVLLVQGFEYGQGTLYYLLPSLALDTQSPFQLVFQDNTAMVFMREPPPGVQPLPREAVFASIESQCANAIEHQPWLPRCARSLGDMYNRLGAYDRSRQWLEFYLSRKTGADPDAERLYEQVRRAPAR